MSDHDHIDSGNASGSDSLLELHNLDGIGESVELQHAHLLQTMQSLTKAKILLLKVRRRWVWGFLGASKGIVLPVCNIDSKNSSQESAIQCPILPPHHSNKLTVNQEGRLVALRT